MGSSSSTRWGYLTAKSTTESKLRLDIRYLARNSMLENGRCFHMHWHRRASSSSVEITVDDGGLILRYRYDGKPMHYRIQITRTACNYGGSRPWVICPHCGKRYAVLCLGSHGRFACRKCLNLCYASQQKSPQNSLFDRADKLRVRLGWGAGIGNPEGDKPVGMHWRTYYRIYRQYCQLVEAINCNSEAMLNRLGIRLDRIKAATKQG